MKPNNDNFATLPRCGIQNKRNIVVTGVDRAISEVRECTRVVYSDKNDGLVNRVAAKTVARAATKDRRSVTV